jgi:uncharacterized protein YukE
MADLIDAAAIARQAKALRDQAPDVRLAMATAVRRRIAELDAQLDRQFTWLGKNEAHPQYTEFYDRWHTDLKHYESACDALKDAPRATQERFIA